MTAMVFTVELFGPRRGQTIKINGHQFVNGVYTFTSDVAGAEHVLKIFSRYHNAFARGTPEYDAEMAKLPLNALKPEYLNGTGEADAKGEAGETNGVLSDREQDGTGSSEASPDGRNEYVNGEAGSSGVQPNGDGHEDARVPKFEEAENIRSPVEPSSEVNKEVVVAIKALDPENKDHWVATGPHAGKPKLSAVEIAYGKAGLTRADVEDALPGYNREVARDQQVDI